MEDLAHSPVGPSGAARRIQCPGSVQAEAKFPETEKSEPSREGDAGHWMLAEMVTGRSLPEVNDQAPNGVFLTDEIVAAVDVAYDRLFQFLKRYGRTPQQGRSETRIALSNIYPGNFGTADFYDWIEPHHIFVADLKLGYRYVDVYRNPQMIDYVSGLLPGGTTDEKMTVTLAIMQPRAYHRDGPFRTWTVRGSELHDAIRASREAAHIAMADNPPTRVGPECRDCRARHACEAYLRTVSDDLHAAHTLRLVEMSDAALGAQLAIVEEMADRLKAYHGGLQEEAMARVRRGARVPGWRVDRTVGREKWNVGTDALRTMGDLLGLKLLREQPITPNQARELGVPEATVAAMSTRPGGGVSLVRDDGAAARKVFG